jgi:hypothetical protein
MWFKENHMEEPKQLIPFDPVPVRARHDGWTVRKQIAFIEALAETGIVEEACRRVGMSRTAADNLRRRPSARHFRRAWDTAIDYSLYRIEEDAFTRTRRGVPRPIFYKGEQVGEWRHFDERLTMFLLRTRRPQHYGKWIDRMLGPEQGMEAPEDRGVTLEAGLEELLWRGRDAPEKELTQLDDEDDDEADEPLDDGDDAPDAP